MFTNLKQFETNMFNFHVRGQPRTDFFTESIIMDYGLICFLQTCSFLFQKMLIDGLDLCGLLVDYCDIFISCLNSHSDGTHSLQRIHWIQTHLDLGWPEVFIFG